MILLFVMDQILDMFIVKRGLMADYTIELHVQVSSLSVKTIFEFTSLTDPFLYRLSREVQLAWPERTHPVFSLTPPTLFRL
jgi:hypothetical protein